MIITALILVVCAILIKTFKFYNLIAGYNTMPEEEKANFNIEKIAALFANVMYVMAAIIVVGYGLSKWLDNEQIGFYATMLAVVIGLPYLLIKANSRAYKNKSKND